MSWREFKLFASVSPSLSSSPDHRFDDTLSHSFSTTKTSSSSDDNDSRSSIDERSLSVPLTSTSWLPSDCSPSNEKLPLMSDLFSSVLPWEVRLRILGFLSLADLASAACVSREWSRAARDGSLWAKVNISAYALFLTEEQLISLALRCGSFLRQLCARGCMQMSDEVLSVFAARCSDLAVVDLTGCRSLSAQAITILAIQCTALRKLTLAGIPAVSDATLQSVGANCHVNLKHLDLTSIKGVSHQGIESMVKQCQNLTSLKLANCMGVIDATLGVIAMLPHLQELSVRGCLPVSDKGVGYIASKCVGLVKLCVSSCRLVTDKSIKALAKACTQLKVLEVASCPQISDSSIELVALHCEQLSRLDLEECGEISDRALIALSNHSKCLESLFLSYCDKITDHGLIELVKGCQDIRHLHLDNCWRLTDSAIKAALTSLGHLQELSIYDCVHVTQEVPTPSRVRLLTFNRDEENRRFLQSALQANEGDARGAKSCIIL